MIETWGFYLFGLGDTTADESPAEFERVYQEYIDLWVKCEEWGFDGLAWPEHHFNKSALSPSPNIIVAMIAALTKKMRFTTLGAALSMTDGRRYAEECAMLTHLTKGRFEPGITPGAGVAEAVKAGIPAEQVRPRYYSAAEVLAKAIAGGPVTHKDDFYNLDNLTLYPPMHLRPGQSVWVTAMRADSAIWTAQRGYKMCTAWSPAPATAALAGQYYEAADAAGIKVDPSMLGLRRRVFVAETDAQAKELYEQSTDLIKAFLGIGFEMADPNIMKFFMCPDDYVIGSPETVAENLIAQCQGGGYGVLQAFLDFAVFPDGMLQKSHELMGTKVGPILRSAEVLPGARKTDVDMEEYKQLRVASAAFADSQQT